MERNLRYLSAAAKDVATAIGYYEGISPRLSVRFRKALNQRLEQIVIRPESFPRDVGEIRFARMARFPYLVFFEIRDSLILVIAVLHGASNPNRWRSRAADG